MSENWLPIKGYEGLYEVSDHGNVKSLRRSFLMRFNVHYKGHLTIQLYRRGCKREKFFVHRLVALAFIIQIDPLRDVVNHKDENKQNNHVSNLEWVTAGENTSKYFENKIIDDIPF